MQRRVAVVACVMAAAMLGGASAASAQLGSLNKIKKTAEDVQKKKTDEKKDENKKEDPAHPQKSEQKSATPAATSSQPDLTEVKIDFVPGERTVFFDDFGDMAPDEPPPHWKVRGGTVALKLGAGAHVLAPGDGVVLTSGQIAVPRDFTFEIVCNCKGEIDWILAKASGASVIDGSLQENAVQTSVSTRVNSKGPLGEGEIKVQPGPITFALWVQQGRVRAYLNGQRVVDVNQVDSADIDHIVLHPSRYRPTDIYSVRLAESAPDVSSALTTTGKYVTHGINFDTDSDRLQPDSAAVIKSIAGALIKNPSLKLAINGYTDATGNADHNLDLSKRRAAAVRSVLVAQFGVDAGRLTADGFGAKDPIGSNDTADGRAQNRRVEFVKQ